MKILNFGNDVVAVLENDSHISKWIEESGKLNHNDSMCKVLEPYISESTIVFDVGAYIGDMTEFFAQKTKAMVYAFEPYSMSFECLAINMAKHHHVECHQMAFSYTTHRGSLTHDGTNFGTAMAEFDPMGGVSFITMDGFDKPVDFIKMDCEGMEGLILQGARATIAKNRPIIVSEVNDSHLRHFGWDRVKLIQEFINLGYSPRNIYPNEEMTGEQFDIICIPTEKLYLYETN